MLAKQETISLVVEQDGTFAAQRLGDQRLLTATTRTKPQHRRVKLHELDIGNFGTGAQAQGKTVTSRDGRVR